MKLRSLAAGLGAGILLLSANTAYAESTPAPVAAPVEAGPTILTLFGTGITLEVGTDATGHLTSVVLGGTAAGAVATEVSPHEVKFVIGDGSTHVEVKARGKSVKTEVEASKLQALLGEHTWSGRLFGVDGEPTIVKFRIDDNGGMPTITLISVTGPGSSAEPLPASTSSGDDGSEAKVRIELKDILGHEARITIKVEVEDDDGHVGAELKISARSDLFATVEAVGPVADPIVTPPMAETPRDDDHEDHDSDHEDDADHHDDADRHDSGRDDADHDDSDRDDSDRDDSDHDDSDRDGQHRESKGRESKDHDSHDSHDD